MPQTNSTDDTHDGKPLKAWLSRRGSHVNHWYSNSSLAKCHARNALPKSVSHFFHPTRATFFGEHGDEGVMTQLWSSRAHRKHRYVYMSSFTQAARHRDGIWGRLALMRKIEYWNISWWVAQVRWQKHHIVYHGLTDGQFSLIGLHMGQRGMGYQRLRRISSILQFAFPESPKCFGLDGFRRRHYFRDRLNIWRLGSVERRFYDI